MTFRLRNPDGSVALDENTRFLRIVFDVTWNGQATPSISLQVPDFDITKGVIFYQESFSTTFGQQTFTYHPPFTSGGQTQTPSPIAWNNATKVLSLSSNFLIRGSWFRIAGVMYA